jgi:HEAT repeat protein
VLVRGRLWVNTSETRRELAKEPEDSGELSIEALVRRLERTNRTEVRSSAAEGLGNLGEAATPAIPALLNCAADPDGVVRKASLDALEAIDPSWPKTAEARCAAPSLVAVLQGNSQGARRAASGLLQQIGPAAVPALTSALLDKEDTLKQIHVVRVLARLGPDAADAIGGLTRALGSQFLHVRIAAAQAMVKIAPPPEPAIPLLVAGLSDRSADARQAMALCLARAGSAAEPAVPNLLLLLVDRNDGVRNVAEAALEQIGPKAVPSLIALVQARDAQRLEAWFDTMSKVAQWRVSPKVDFVVIRPEEVWKNLSWAAYDIPEERVRLEAAQEAAFRVLGSLGPAAGAAVPAITEALADPNPKIQLAAVRTLGQIGSEARSATYDLIQMLLHDHESFREEAVRTLGQIGAGAQPAIPALTEALGDGYPRVQEEAAEALAKIEEQVAATPAGPDTDDINEE